MIVALVISNLLYPVVAIGVAAVLCILIWLRHRRPKSVEANMRAFNKGLRALAPETRGSATNRGSGRAAPTRLRPPAPTGLPVVPERPARIPPPSRPMATAPAGSTSPAAPPVTAMSGPSSPADGAEAEAG